MDVFELVQVTIIISVIKYYYIFPKKDSVDCINIPQEYIIDVSNIIESQLGNECATFASAYVLRHFGVEVKGVQIYRGFPCKLFDGSVMCKGIVKYFRKYKFNASFYKGNVVTLKRQISKGVPVIVFIQALPNNSSLHFVPVIGYDKEYFYLAESASAMVNCSNKVKYNRKIKIDEFEKLWKTWVPFYKNSYITVVK